MLCLAANENFGVQMEKSELEQVKKLRAASDETAANDLLAKGWVLIDTASGKDESGYPMTRYSFAWTKDTPPPSDY
jgi:hypothetical protein